MIGILVFAVIVLILYFLLLAAAHIAVDLVGLIISLLIWAVIGWLAGQLMRGRGYGALGDILLGIGGGIVGSLIFQLLRIGVGGLVGNIIVGVVGAVILILIGRVLRRA